MEKRHREGQFVTKGKLHGEALDALIVLAYLSLKTSGSRNLLPS